MLTVLVESLVTSLLARRVMVQVRPPSALTGAFGLKEMYGEALELSKLMLANVKPVTASLKVKVMVTSVSPVTMEVGATTETMLGRPSTPGGLGSMLKIPLLAPPVARACGWVPPPAPAPPPPPAAPPRPPRGGGFFGGGGFVGALDAAAGR